MTLSTQNLGKTGPSELLDGLPIASSSERLRLREVSNLRLDLSRIAKILEAMPQPSYEDLANRPISIGEPFTLGSKSSGNSGGT